MKKILSHICAITACVTSFAQTPALTLATDKTTSLIFPFPVIHVDRGTKDILVEQVKAAANILLLKAADANFRQTNLSVVTDDKSVYCFCVSYASNPSTFVYRLSSQTSATPDRYATAILNNPSFIHGIRDKKWDMLAKVCGIYIQGNTIYYQLQIDNQSPLDYAIDFIRFSIRDKKQAKRTAIQQIELKPLYMTSNSELIRANSISTIVIALEKFTIPDAKYLSVEIMEKNGGRNLHLKVGNKDMLRGKILNEL